jgi:hypothetical protein
MEQAPLIPQAVRQGRLKGKPLIFAATSKASSISLSAGTTRDTRPQASAWVALIQRLVSTMSIALALPMARGRRWVPPAPGTTPMVISGWPNLALSAAMTMSHIIATSQPPPSATPPTAAITGLRTRRMVSQLRLMYSVR